MKRCISLLILLLVLCGTAVAEKHYSLPIDLSHGMPLQKENYVDENTYIDPTIEMHITSDRFRDTQYWMADIVIADPSQLRTMPATKYTSGMTMPMKQLSKRANAVLAMDGDYFYLEVTKKGSYVLRQGELYSENLIGASDILLIDEDGDFHIIHKPVAGEVTPEIDGKRAINGLCFGPALVEDGVVCQIEQNDFMATDKIRARIALCQIDTLHYAVVCTSANSSSSVGCTLQDFADLLGTLGVKTAYNMDGGNSAMMFTGTRMINMNRSIRDINDIVYFASAWQPEEDQ